MKVRTRLQIAAVLPIVLAIVVAFVVLATSPQVNWAVLISLAVSAIAMVGISWWAGASIAGGLRLLRAGSEAVATGDLEHRVVVVGQDEVGEVAEAFNHMTRQIRISQAELAEEIAERREAEAALQQAHAELESRVESRTLELSKANAALQSEMEDREQAERALRESESKHRRLIETMNQGLGMVDEDVTVDYFNSNFCRMLGYSQNEVVGRPLMDFLDESNQAILREQLGRRERRERESYEMAWTRKDGQQVPTIVAPQPLFDEDGTFRGSFAVVTDISDRKRAEEELRRARDELDVRVQERTAELSEANRTLEAEVGERKAAEVEALRHVNITTAINKVFQEALTCQTQEDVARTCLAVAEALAGSRFGFIGEVNEAGRFDTLALSDPGWDACRMPTSDAVVAIRDMEIRGVWGRAIKDERSLIANEPAAHPDSVGTPEGHPPLRCILGVPLKHGGETIGMIALANKEGGYQIHDQAAVEALSVAFVEALMRKRAEEALQRAHDELEVRVQERTAELQRSNADLEQFAYVASHDLQEPLRMVGSYVQLLERRYKDKLDEDANEFIAFAVDGAKRMQGLINDLLMYSRVGRRGKEFERTSCERVLERCLANLQTAIAESGANVTHDALPEVMGDETQLTQLFQNLVGNAIKFRAEKPPRVHVSAGKTDEEWMFSVRDSGLGMDPKHADRVFMIFQRLHTREAYPGTGMGLAICRKIVERHGGRIWVESEPGKGSTFHFTIAASGPAGSGPDQHAVASER